MFLNNCYNYHFPISITFQRRLVILTTRRSAFPFLVLKTQEDTKLIPIFHQITQAKLA